MVANLTTFLLPGGGSGKARVPFHVAAGRGARRTKWPREVKPRLDDVMRDIAVLRRAAHVLGEPIYVFGDDVKDYFNQLAMAPSELWKLGVVFLRQGEDLEPSPRYAAGEGDARLIFVSEKRLAARPRRPPPCPSARSSGSPRSTCTRTTQSSWSWGSSAPCAPYDCGGALPTRWA